MRNIRHSRHYRHFLKNGYKATQVMPIRKDSKHRFCVAFAANKTSGKLPKGTCRPCNPDYTEKGTKIYETKIYRNQYPSD